MEDNSWDKLRKELAEQDRLYVLKKYGAFGQMLNDVMDEAFKDIAKNLAKDLYQGTLYPKPKK